MELPFKYLGLSMGEILESNPFSNLSLVKLKTSYQVGRASSYHL